MTSPLGHSKGRVAAYISLLRRCAAPKSLIDDFLDLIEIDNGIALEPDGTVESLDLLLLDVCRRFDFAAPFDQPNRKAFFRPYGLKNTLPSYCADVPPWDDDFDPKVEQAFRRGYDQGFGEACQLNDSGSDPDRKARQLEIHRWRISPVNFGPSRPGTIESFGIKVSVRSSLSTKLRWQVLERDCRRCVVCGACAADGATLHVDHVVSIYNGGRNDLENLQTLCEPCNLGKGKD